MKYLYCILLGWDFEENLKEIIEFFWEKKYLNPFSSSKNQSEQSSLNILRVFVRAKKGEKTVFNWSWCQLVQICMCCYPSATCPPYIQMMSKWDATAFQTTVGMLLTKQTGVLHTKKSVNDPPGHYIPTEAWNLLPCVHIHAVVRILHILSSWLITRLHTAAEYITQFWKK